VLELSGDFQEAGQCHGVTWLAQAYNGGLESRPMHGAETLVRGRNSLKLKALQRRLDVKRSGKFVSFSVFCKLSNPRVFVICLS